MEAGSDHYSMLLSSVKGHGSALNLLLLRAHTALSFKCMPAHRQRTPRNFAVTHSSDAV
jgi:hypothetical protein